MDCPEENEKSEVIKVGHCEGRCVGIVHAHFTGVLNAGAFDGTRSSIFILIPNDRVTQLCADTLECVDRGCDQVSVRWADVAEFMLEGRISWACKACVNHVGHAYSVV